MTRRWMTLPLAGLVAMTLASPAAAEAPFQMPLQGVLRDNAGMPVAEGSFAVTFALYTDETGGAPVWMESWPASGTCAGGADGCLAVTNGAFHALLGSHTPMDPGIFAATPVLWLGMTVESDPELPRRRVGATGYSMFAAHAGSATSAEGLSCSGCVGAVQLDPAGLAAALPGWDQNASDDLVANTAFGGDVSGTYDALHIDCVGCIGAGALDAAVTAQLEAAGSPLLETVSNGTLTNTFDTSVTNSTVGALAEGLTGVSSTVTLPDVGVILALTVDLHVLYADVKDLTVTLTAPPPGSQTVTLVARNLTGPDIDGTFPTTLTPVEPLTAFEGLPMAGEWTVKIVDDVPSFSPTGTLESWGLTVHSLSQEAVASNASLDLRGHTLTGLTGPVADTDAATKGYVDGVLARDVFGDGSDGDVTISGTVTLNRNMAYHDLTIAPGAILRPAGWMIFVSGTLTNSGTIERNGNPGSAGSACSGYCFSGGAAGGGGAGDAGGFLPPIVAGSGGGGGGNGQCPGCSSGSPGGTGGAGQAAKASLVPSAGKNGGNGGPATGQSGGGGGAGGTSTATKSPNLTKPTLHTLLNMVDYADLAKFTTSGSSGGGGGGAGANGCQRGGGGGGGAGSSGGLIVIVARSIASVGTIIAKGGDGAAGGGGCECGGVCGYAGGGGGGGGGNGGAVVLAWQAKAAGGTIDLAGGTGGPGGPNAGTAGTGGGGATGSPGVTIDVDLSSLFE